MKKHPRFPFLLLLIAACGAAAPSRGHAQLIDLTDDATVRANGTYTYYAEQTAGAASYFTTAFYPGPSNHDSATPSDRDGTRDDSVTTAAAISIGAGELTDYTGTTPNTGTNVSGWIGTTSYLGTSTSGNPGTFDILLNLGAVYSNISEVVVNYTDAAGHRFTTTANAQSVFYGVTAPDTTSGGGLTLFGNATAAAGTTAGNMDFTTGSPVSAQYIDIRLNMSVPGSGTGSAGGYINSIQVLAVPEPPAGALLFGFLPVWWLAGRARKASPRA